MSDYAYAAARIKSLEAKIFGRSTYENLLEAAPEGIVSFLGGAGYGGAGDGSGNDMDKLLENEFASVLELVRSITPEEDRRLIDIFAEEYDFYNIGVFFRHAAAGREVREKELSRLGRIDPDIIRQSLAGAGNAPDLPEPFSSIVQKHRDTDGDDAVSSVEKAKWEYFLEVTRGNAFMNKLTVMMIDLVNIRNFLNARTFSVEESVFTSQVVPGGRIGRDTFRENYGMPPENFVRYLELTDYSSMSAGLMQAVTVQQGRERLWAIPVICDNYLAGYLREVSRDEYFSIEPLVGYIFLKKQEAACLRSVWVGKRNGLGREEIKERISV